MTHIDHHSKPYDEGTLNKLEIFSSYVESWLPTFIMQKNITEINIVDFFAGLGYDSEGKPGTPILILEKINVFFGNLMKNNTIINLFLNEYNSYKYNALVENCQSYLNNNSRLKKFVNVHYSNEDFNSIYQKIIEITSYHPNLFLIDQSGIKFTNQNNFNTLLKLKRTDFLFFISSSFFKRFSNEDEFSKHLKINEEELSSNPYNFIHRVVLDKYKSLIPKESELMIFPFSIKKAANIYGIIFGSKHILGVEKFLKIAWDKNRVNGEADYDIDEDENKTQLLLNFDNPEQSKQLTKIEAFKNKVEELLKQKKCVTNKELYYFTCDHGHIAQHTIGKLRELKRNKNINYKGHTKISWDAIHKSDLVTFRWIK